MTALCQLHYPERLAEVFWSLDHPGVSPVGQAFRAP